MKGEIKKENQKSRDEREGETLLLVAASSRLIPDGHISI